MSASLRSFRRHGLLWLMLALPATCATRLTAQFNGPADTARDTVNAPHPLTTDPAILYPPARTPRVQTGDVLKVTIAGVTDYSATDRVSAEGSILLPLLEDTIPVEGLTVKETQKLIAARYVAAGMYVNPQVRVDITESPKSVVVLFGEIKGIQQIPSGNRRLFEVLASAGGLGASTSHVLSIDRPGLLESINIDVGSDPEQSKYANIPIFAGDTITTGSIGRFYLLGAFKGQGAFPLSSTAPLTLMQLVAIGGGRPTSAKLRQIHIVRTIGTQRTVVTVDLKAALDGTGPDPVIQSDDILIAPTDHLKQIISLGGVTTILGLGLTFYTLFHTF